MTTGRRLAVVSGASGLLGRAIALRLAEDGYALILVFHKSDMKEMDNIKNGLAGNGHQIEKCDLSDLSSVNALIKKIKNQFGTIDILVHSAWPKITRKKILETDVKNIREQFDVGFFGALNLFVATANLMRESKTKGVLIGVTSSVAEPGVVSRNMGGYISAKYALRGLLKELAVELSQDSIRVHAVSPGFMEGGLNADLPDLMVRYLKEKNGGKEFLKPETVAGAVSFLCSKDAENLSGLSLAVSADGVNNL